MFPRKFPYNIILLMILVFLLITFYTGCPRSDSYHLSSYSGNSLIYTTKMSKYIHTVNHLILAKNWKLYGFRGNSSKKFRIKARSVSLKNF